MTRFITSLTVALGFAGAVALHAQAPQTTTQTTKATETKTVSFTGCVAAGTAPQSFILNQATPVGQTSRTVTGTSGTTTTSTTMTYALIPAEKMVLTPHVGHKVEVTGELISGDMKTETTTTSPATGTTTKETTKTPMQQFKVTAVKMLAESCTP